jgi:outer membrane protein assembly factor BamD (BamD/ComL family)
MRIVRTSFISAAILALAPVGTPAVRAEEVLNMEEEVTVSEAMLKRWFDEGLKALETGNDALAAQRFKDLLAQGGKGTAVGQEAQFQLGVALFKLGLLQSAFTAFEPVVDAGAAHPRYLATLGYLLGIARQTGNDPSVMLRISEYPPEVYPADDADELHFLVGQFFLNEESLGDALTRFQAVSAKKAAFLARARYLEGVIHVSMSNLGTERQLNPERLTQAAEAFKTVLRLRRDRGDDEGIGRVADEATLALGRLFYSTRQYDVAVRYYDEVGTSNSRWIEAVYEASWVHFQLKNYGKALGYLHTVNSPYFANQYFPESRVLQALILFYNCRYDDADVIVKDFVADYYPLLNQLRAEINQFGDPNAFYGWLAGLASQEQRSEYSARFKRIFNAALEDKRLRRKFEVVANLNRELQRIDALGAKGADKRFLAGLKGEVEAYRSLVVGEAGSLAQSRLLRVMKDLQRHLGSALKIKGETLRARRGDISNAAAQEQASAAAAYRELLIDDEHIEWPFDGEYWRDELGFYFYDIESQCAAPAGDEGEAAP